MQSSYYSKQSTFLHCNTCTQHQ